MPTNTMFVGVFLLWVNLVFTLLYNVYKYNAKRFTQ